MAWTGIARGLTQLLSWATTLVVARILTPVDYGIVGMAGMALEFVHLLSEFGIGMAIVQSREITRTQIARLNGLALNLSVALCLICVAGSGLVANLLNEPRVGPVLMVLSTGFIISGFRIVPAALLTRDLRFRNSAMLQTVESVTMTGLTVVLALTGFSYWSLVIGNIGAKLLATILANVMSPPPVAWPPPLSSIIREVRVGRDVVVSRIAWYAYSSSDGIVIAETLGTAAFGLYSVAVQIGSIPIARVHQLYQEAAGSVFASVQDDRAALARYVLLITEGVAILSFPMSVGLAMVSDVFVQVVLGPQWAAAAVSLQFLAFSATLRSLDPLLAQVLISTGRASVNRRNMIVAALTMPLLFLAGSRWGTGGVAAAWVFGYPLVVFAPQLRAVMRVADITLFGYIRALLPALAYTSVMAAALAVLRPVTEPLGPRMELIVLVAAAAALYAAIVLFFHGSRLAHLKSVALARTN